MIYFWKYFKDKKTDNLHSINHLLSSIIEIIGKNHSKEIHGNNGNRHKGIKKIISHCKLKYDTSLTATEVKTILKTKYIPLSYEYYKIPYNIVAIFNSIIDLSVKNTEIKEKCTICVTNKKMENPNCYDILIPGIYICIEDIDIDKKANIFKSSKKKISTIKNELYENNKGICKLIQ